MRRLVRPALLGTGLAVVLAGLLPTPAYAHGFGERYGLPVPLLHGVAGSSGFWDEIIFLVLLGGFVVALAFRAFGGGRKGRGRKR